MSTDIGFSERERSPEGVGHAVRGRASGVSWTTSGTGEDDESLGRAGHRDVAVDRSLDARTEGLGIDEDDEVELEPLRQLGRQRSDAGRLLERRITDDAGDPLALGMLGQPGV